MSFLLTRIRRALAEPPQEPMTGALLAALAAHWECLFASDPVKFALLRPHMELLHADAARTEEAQQQYVTATLTAWEARRAAFQLDAALGGPPGRPGSLDSFDWGTPGFPCRQGGRDVLLLCFLGSRRVGMQEFHVRTEKCEFHRVACKKAIPVRGEGGEQGAGHWLLRRLGQRAADAGE